MDIAKIRKKAREKEQKTEEREKSAPPPAESGGGDVAGEKAAEIPMEQPPGAGPEEARHEAGGGPTEHKPPEDRPDEIRPEEKKDGPSGMPSETEEDKTLELLTFSLAKEEFAFRVPEVEEIVRYQRITKVPTMPGYVCGITSLRGKIIPVIDLRTKLGLKDLDAEGQGVKEPDLDSEARKHEKILILAGPKGLIGALIDKVTGVVRLSQSKVLEPPAHLNEEEVKFIEGVVIYGKRFISIIRSEDALNIEAD